MDLRAAPLTAVLEVALATALHQELSLETVGDLLNHTPRRYRESGAEIDLADAQHGDRVTVIADVQSASVTRMRSRSGSLLRLILGDGRSTLEATFFNPYAVAKVLVPGVRAVFDGTVREYRGTKSLTHPSFIVLPAPGQPPTVAAGGDFVGVGRNGDTEQVVRELLTLPVLPIYGATKKLTSWQIMAAVGTVLRAASLVADRGTAGETEPAGSGSSVGDADAEAPPVAPLGKDLTWDDGLTAAQRRAQNLCTDLAAYRKVHRPGTRAEVAVGMRRLQFDEALSVQLVMAVRRRDELRRTAIVAGAQGAGVEAAVRERLPFALTAGQESVLGDIGTDLVRGTPMNRLVQGEVGSGKTLVALLAMVRVVDSGHQAVLLAPTEVLAQQHAVTIRGFLGEAGKAGQLGAAATATGVALLHSSQSTAERRQALLDIVSGTAGIIIGTHSLLSESVEYFSLGLVVVDEQHRFGVRQRDALRERGRAGTTPHLLVMTATPIPRTIAMTFFGDLDVSSLRELPRGRSSISTTVVSAGNERWLARVWQRVREEVEKGNQAYVVCPRITADDATDGGGIGGPALGEGAAVAATAGGGAAGPYLPGLPGAVPAGTLVSAEGVYAALSRGLFPELQVGLLHGRMDAAEKEQAMARFVAGETGVLVATTVIEVGVDVPRATIMVICDADRFGVSQLHQLRGRVGRGKEPGVCLLVTSVDQDATAAQRLQAVAASQDGFALAEMDLQLRREGDVLGDAQSGVGSSLRFLSVIEHGEIIVAARELAEHIVAEDPALQGSPYLAQAAAEWAARAETEYLERS